MQKSPVTVSSNACSHSDNGNMRYHSQNSFQSTAMTRVATRRPITAESPVRTWAIPYVISVAKGQVSIRVPRFPLMPLLFHTHSSVADAVGP